MKTGKPDPIPNAQHRSSELICCPKLRSPEFQNLCTRTLSPMGATGSQESRL